MNIEKLKEDYIKYHKDFPKKGITFIDMGPMFADVQAMGDLMEVVEGVFHKSFELDNNVDLIAGIDARGFLFGPTLADRTYCGFVPIRKKGKLPGKCLEESYSLEYADDSLEIQENIISKGQKVIIVDDILATGGTALAAAKLVERAGGVVEGFIFLGEIKALEGRKKIAEYEVQSLMEF